MAILRWTLAAVKDLEDSLEYIAKTDSPAKAYAVAEDLGEACWLIAIVHGSRDIDALLHDRVIRDD